MEGTERQLCTRLSDRLRSDDPDDLTLLDEDVGSEVTAVALSADALLGLTGEYRADFDLLDGRLLDALSSSFADLFASTDEDFTRRRMDHIVYGDTTEDALIERCYYFVIVIFLGELSSYEATERTAVFFGDDDILRDVDETTGEVPCVSRLQSGICKTLTSTVGRDEVLEHGEPFLEVGENWVLNDLPTFATTLLWLSHQTTDTGELTDLFLRTTSPRVHHHEDGVEALVVFTQVLHQDAGELAIDVRPGVDDLVIAFVVRNEPAAIVHHDLLDSFVPIGDELSLLFGDDDVTKVEGQTALEGHVVPEVLDIIEELRRDSHTADLDHAADDVTQTLLTEDFVDVADFLRYVLVDEQTTHRSIDHVADRLAILDIIDVDLNRSVQVDLTFVVGDRCFLDTIEGIAITLSTWAELGDVVEPEHHVLRGDGNRRTIGRVEDVVRGKHEHLCLEDSFVAKGEVDSHLVTIEVSVEGRTR